MITTPFGLTVPWHLPGGDADTRFDEVRALADGAAIVRDAARSARLLDAFREKRATAEQAARVLGRVVVAASGAFNALTTALTAGVVKLAGWWSGMKTAVVGHNYAGSLALLGPEPAPADLAATAVAAGKQLGYLAGFKADLAAGATLLSAAPARAELYARAVWGVAMNVLRGRATRDGYTMERRFLGPADHCPDCLDEAARLWQPIGSLLPIGETVCMAFCMCEFRFR